MIQIIGDNNNNAAPFLTDSICLDKFRCQNYFNRVYYSNSAQFAFLVIDLILSRDIQLKKNLLNVTPVKIWHPIEFHF